MKIDLMLSFDSLAEVPAVARAAEEIGFDALWSTEVKHEAFLPLALVADHTRQLHFGTAVAIAFSRSPTILAHAAWDLAALSRGRLMLGLGTQVKAHVERRFGMAWEHPAPKLREIILALRAIWQSWQTGGPLDFRGQFVKLTLMPPAFNPGPIAAPRVPIFIAGVNTALCMVAGEVADGFHVHPFHSAKYLREVTLPGIAAGAAKAGRSLSEVELASSVFVFRNAAEREAARAKIAFYAATPTYRGVLECHGWTAAGERLSRLAARQCWDEMAGEITDEMLSVFALDASEGDLAAKLIERYDGLLDRVALYKDYRPDEDAFWRQLVRAIHKS